MYPLRLLLVPIFVVLCIAQLGCANPIVELEQVDVIPEDKVEVVAVDAESDSGNRNAKQFNFGIGFGYGGRPGGYYGNGGYGGYNGYGGYPHNHGYGQGYYAPGYGNYNQGYGHYNNHYNGFDDHHHHGYDHHHHHHGHHGDFRAFNGEFVPEMVPNYLPQRPYVAYVDDPYRGINPAFIRSKPIVSEVDIPVPVIGDNICDHLVATTDAPMEQDDEFMNKDDEPVQNVELVEKEIVKEKKMKSNEEIIKDKTEKEDCNCKNKKVVKSTTEKKN